MSPSKGACLETKPKRGRPLTIPTSPWACPVMRKLVSHELVSFETDCEPRGCRPEQFPECLWIHDIIEE